MSSRSCARRTRFVSHQNQIYVTTRFVTTSVLFGLAFRLMAGASHKHWTRWTARLQISKRPQQSPLYKLSTSQLPKPLRQKFQARLLICNQGVSQMICPCDFKRLLLHNPALRTFAKGASRSARQGHNPFYREADCSFHSKKLPSTFQSSQRLCRSQTLCTMTEAVQAPPADNGAVDAEVVALRRQIADLQVSTPHFSNILHAVHSVSSWS